MKDIPKLKKVARYILKNYRQYGVFLNQNQINFLSKFRKENFAPTEKQISYFYLTIAQIQNKNIETQIKGLKYMLERFEEFRRNIQL